jgi:hypothetical protein
MLQFTDINSERLVLILVMECLWFHAMHWKLILVIQYFKISGYMLFTETDVEQK